MAKKKAKAKAKAKTAALGPAVKNRYSKSEILTSIADSTGLPRKSVGSVLDALDGLVARHISARGCGEFVLPGC